MWQKCSSGRDAHYAGLLWVGHDVDPVIPCKQAVQLGEGLLEGIDYGTWDASAAVNIIYILMKSEHHPTPNEKKDENQHGLVATTLYAMQSL